MVCEKADCDATRTESPLYAVTVKPLFIQEQELVFRQTANPNPPCFAERRHFPYFYPFNPPTMTNTLRYPLRNISPTTIQELQEKYPNASVQIELSDEPTPGSLSEQGFWELIAQLDWSKTGQDEAVIEPVVAALAAGPLRHIYDFKDILSHKLYLLDTEAHARHIGEASYQEEATDFSPDIFLFARLAAVANGQEVFEQARQNPAAMPRDVEFAPLLRVANEAYQRQNGKLMHFVAAYPIETFSNRSGWKLEAE